MESMRGGEPGGRTPVEGGVPEQRNRWAAEAGSFGAAADDETEVRRRAYERYLARAGAPGSDVDDWLTAEREVRELRARGTGEQVARASIDSDVDERTNEPGAAGGGLMGELQGALSQSAAKPTRKSRTRGRGRGRQGE